MEGGEEKVDGLLIIQNPCCYVPYTLADFPDPYADDMPGRFAAVPYPEPEEEV